MDGFGSRLKRLRQDFNLTQTALAEHLGVVPSAVGKYESNKHPQSYPSVEALLKIADFFNVSTDYLLRGVQVTPSVANNISGNLSNSPFIQANNGGVVLNGEGNNSLPPEALELLRIYNDLSGRDRLRLLSYAVELGGDQ